MARQRRCALRRSAFANPSNCGGHRAGEREFRGSKAEELRFCENRHTAADDAGLVPQVIMVLDSILNALAESFSFIGLDAQKGRA